MNFQSFLGMFGFGGGIPPRNNNIFHRKTSALINVILVLHQLFILCSEAYYLDNDPYRHKQVLGPKASYVVEWSVNWKENSITFQVSAETKGWIGFGLSKDGRMSGADIIIGGVAPSGKPYFDDAHVLGNRSIQIDQQQDWKLIGAWEKGKRTYLTVKRSLETCDPNDYQITNDLVAMIWAFGETDEVQYHMKRRGSAPVYLLDPQISDEIAHAQYRQIGPHSNLYLVQRLALTNTLRLAPKPTTVWCSIQRGPRLLARHDIIGMGAFLPTMLARRHVQQMRVFKCAPPQQTDALSFFEPYSKMKGEECYLNDKRTFPLGFCRELVYVHGRGGKPFYFPEEIGIPIGESETEFFLLETTYDNPRTVPNLEIEAGVEIVYSHRQKLSQASLIQVGYGTFGTFMIPPKSVMNIYGSCGPTCTSSMFPKEGVNVFAAMLQTRSLGRRIRLQHFRGSQEFKWILKDDNYDSEFQQMRLLHNDATILPGDQITTHCTYNSWGRNRTSFSGFSTQDESCTAYMYVSTRIPFFRCTSEYPEEKLLTKYGIGNVTWDLTWQERYVTEPRELEGTWLGDVVDHKAHARSTNVDLLQRDYKFSPHLESCPNIRDVTSSSQSRLSRKPTAGRTQYLSSTVSYPQNVKEYQDAPTSLCKAGHGPHHDHDYHDDDAPPIPHEPIRTPPHQDQSPLKSISIVDNSFSRLPKLPVGPPPTRRPGPPIPPSTLSNADMAEHFKQDPFITEFEDAYFKSLERPAKHDIDNEPPFELFKEPPRGPATPLRQSRNKLNRTPSEHKSPQKLPSPPGPQGPSGYPRAEPLTRIRIHSSKEQVDSPPKSIPPRPVVPQFKFNVGIPQKALPQGPPLHYFNEQPPKKSNPPALQYHDDHAGPYRISTPKPPAHSLPPPPPHKQTTKNPVLAYFEDLQNRPPPPPPRRPSHSSREQTHKRPTEKPLLEYFEEHPYNQQRHRPAPPPPPEHHQPYQRPAKNPVLEYFEDVQSRRPPFMSRPSSKEQSSSHKRPTEKPNIQYHSPVQPYKLPPIQIPSLEDFEELPNKRPRLRSSSKEQTYKRPTEKPAVLQYFEEKPIQKALQKNQLYRHPVPGHSQPILEHFENPPARKPPPHHSSSEDRRPAPKPILQYFEDPTYTNPDKKPAIHYSEEVPVRPPTSPRTQSLPELNNVYPSYPKVPAKEDSREDSREGPPSPRRLKRPRVYYSNEDTNPQQPQHAPPQPQPFHNSQEVPARKLKRPSPHSSEELHPHPPKNPIYHYQPLEESPQSRQPIQEHSSIAALPPSPPPPPPKQSVPTTAAQKQPQPTTFDIKTFLNNAIFNKPSDLTIPVVQNNKNANANNNFDTISKNTHAGDNQVFLKFFDQLANMFSSNSRSDENQSLELVKALSNLKQGISIQNVQHNMNRRQDVVEHEKPKPSKNNIKLLLLQQTKFD